jgi:hypothetical protein
MSNLIGYCGYNCEVCAARSEDRELRQKLVDGWRKLFGHEMYDADNVRCVGCKNEGPHADTSCAVRPCAIEKGLDSCTDCDEFPCGKLRGLMSCRHGLLTYCAPGKGVTREEYELCMRQFDSMPILMKQLVEKGKLPEWTVEETR